MYSLEDAAVDDHLAEARLYGQTRKDLAQRGQLVVLVQRLHL